MIKVMVTGHRPNKLGGYDENNPTRTKIKLKIKDILLKLKQVDKDVEGISGMALGIDTDFVKVCRELKIPYIAYVPFVGQESRWPVSSQDEYRYLISQAKKVIIVSKGNYSPRKMQVRNEAMGDNSDIAIAVWNGDQEGGTANCVRYLKEIKRKIVHINPNDD